MPIITDIFKKLATHVSIDAETSFSEPHFIQKIDALSLIEFDASGDLLKEILEGNYRDGIDGFEEVENDGKRITGVFLDVVSSKLTKRYRFEVSGNNVFYQLENLADVKKDINYSEVDFARTGMFGQSKQPKKCVKGDSCGNTCIKSGLPCNKKPTPEQKEAIQSLVSKEKGGGLVLVSGALARSKPAGDDGKKTDPNTNTGTRSKGSQGKTGEYRTRTTATGKKQDIRKVLSRKIAETNKSFQKDLKAFQKLPPGQEKDVLGRKLASKQKALFKIVDISNAADKAAQRIQFDGDDLKALGLKKSPNEAELTAAYRVASLKYHPDTNRNKSPKEQAKSVELFRQATDAYKKMKQRLYDVKSR